MTRGITIVGLGPGAPNLLTIEAQQVLQSAEEIYLRTRQHPTVEALSLTARIYSFDDVYERASTFEEVYAEIAARVVELGHREQGVVYAVPGHPLVGETSVQRILTLAEQEGLPVRIVEGLSFVEPVCARLRLDPLQGLQIADATALALAHYPMFNPDLPLLIGQLYNRDLAAEIKLVLMMAYPDDHLVSLVRAAGTATEAVVTIPLYELDRCAEVDHLTSLYVPPLSTPGSLAAFQEIVAHLRAPEGCPWDREQTHRSLRPFLLEETYEVLEALDSEDLDSLKEELGDLLLQILLHTQIAIEQGEFKMADVVSSVVTKLKRRHPHVFGQVHVSNAQEVLVNWERIKSEEKAAQQHKEGEHEEAEGLLAGIPDALPALARAQALQRRVERAGLDWPDVGHVWSKVEEEMTELRQAHTGAAQEIELGDVLFSLVSLARWLDIDAESALREATARFERRFQEVERKCATHGQPLNGLGTARWKELWEETKNKTAGYC
ncbi:MAG: nucleoside triphosphate pyrophosphohydrolase [Anaerolineae bacterium]